MTPLFDHHGLFEVLAAQGIPEQSRRELHAIVEEQLQKPRHGDLRKKWLPALESIPKLCADMPQIENGTVRMGGETNIEVSALMGLHPWRKGPLAYGDIQIDCEWRSDLKWARLEPYLGNIKHHKVLDIGCGNGYFLWQLIGAGAKLALGIDPSLLYLSQFWLFRRGLPRNYPAWLLPLTLAEMPKSPPMFDTVLSMGVLYHRKNPLQHLERVLEQCKSGGQVLLETLVVDGDEKTVLLPSGRYAQMRNTWFLPSAKALKLWCERIGMLDVKIVDITPTSTDEQRSTEWMTFDSLKDFLDPSDPKRTIEGYPAPKRAILFAKKR